MFKINIFKDSESKTWHSQKGGASRELHPPAGGKDSNEDKRGKEEKNHAPGESCRLPLWKTWFIK